VNLEKIYRWLNNLSDEELGFVLIYMKAWQKGIQMRGPTVANLNEPKPGTTVCKHSVSTEYACMDCSKERRE
jgi:hypothetical protein